MHPFGCFVPQWWHDILEFHAHLCHILIFLSEHCTNQRPRAIKKSFNQFEPSFFTDSLITLADFLVILIS